MGKKRFERVANSKRPAAKLGGGGGWNTDGARGLVDGDPTSLPEYPTSERRPRDDGVVTATSADANKRGRTGDDETDGDAPDDGAAAAAGGAPSQTTAPPSEPKVYKKVFSGRGWRAAAPGFGDPEDTQGIDGKPAQPRILVGNLPTDVDPDELVEIIEAHSNI